MNRRIAVAGALSAVMVFGTTAATTTGASGVQPTTVVPLVCLQAAEQLVEARVLHGRSLQLGILGADGFTHLAAARKSYASALEFDRLRKACIAKGGGDPLA